jgi:hypothetical protein
MAKPRTIEPIKIKPLKEIDKRTYIAFKIGKAPINIKEIFKLFKLGRI